MAESAVIRFQEPIKNLNGYDRRLSVSQQSIALPEVFRDAMLVREEVFVKEQGCSILMEADPDDARSCHWVVYDTLPGEDTLTAAGTLRLVPFPHDAHPLPGWSWDFDPDAEDPIMTANPVSYIVDRSTTYHDGKEPYIKLGRWAVRKEFRGRGLANLLVRNAFDWARTNPKFFNPALVASHGEKAGLESERNEMVWKGLVCVHAQEYIVPSWTKLGFKLDDGMGKWTEAGIPHVGMFQTLELVQ